MSDAQQLRLEEAEALLAARNLPASLALFARAEAEGADPDRCDAGRWMIGMLGGSFEQAWRASDRIRLRGAPDPNRFWQGEPLAGKRVILRCLHGFGDAVQFLRYAPRLRSLAASLVLEVNPRLVALARCFDGVDEVITWGEDAPPQPPVWDTQIEVMELPYLFRTQLADLPIHERYLRRPDEPPPPAAGPIQVGVVWTSGEWNTTRSIPFADLAPVFALTGCQFWNLERHPTAEARSLSRDEAATGSILGLAGKIARMNLVITVDTLAAHLAGALGVPCWLLLQHAADWRWMHARPDSPWYPSLRLFRQPTPGDWPSAIAEVCKALQHYASKP